MPRRRTSTGEMISTLCFLGVGLQSLGEAALAPLVQASIPMPCALACRTGAARRPIARMLRRE
ncbi:hypothetical protein [uncultured Roseovarius sp.]|uniref:hypothetical protein n=1 Tax=uncultured Roseovarius sp. TaxID=293344 RepID=UPI00260EB3A1|nr:hypothetical protein [uncultured Roseovarius sp.]